MQNFVTLVAGFIFAIGLGLSGMTQPAKVLGFLNIFGRWDPTLLFVMIGAIGVHATVYAFIQKKPRPVLAEEWHLPKKTAITPSLLFGAAIFGIGWGLAGFCPGPAVVSLASFRAEPWVFFVAMILGMAVYRGVEQVRASISKSS